MFTEEALDLAINDEEVENVFELARQIQAKSDSTLVYISNHDQLSPKEIKITIDTLLKNEFTNIENEVTNSLADINRDCD